MTKELPPWRGIITALNVPFNMNGAVDLDALAAHADYALRAGVAGFLVPVMASEVGALTPQEREDAVRTVVAAARGQTVWWHAWGGDPKINDFIAWVGGLAADAPDKEQFGEVVGQRRLDAFGDRSGQRRGVDGTGPAPVRGLQGPERPVHRAQWRHLLHRPGPDWPA